MKEEGGGGEELLKLSKLFKHWGKNVARMFSLDSKTHFSCIKYPAVNYKSNAGWIFTDKNIKSKNKYIQNSAGEKLSFDRK